MSTFTTVNPATVGEPTKKSDFDKVFENTLALSTFLGDRNLTDGGILIGSGTGAITPMSTMAGGALVVGQAGADPAPKSVGGDISALTSAGAFTIAANAVNQSKLKSTIGSVYDEQGSTNYYNHTLPGGQYGFYPQVKAETPGDLSVMICSSGGTTAYVTNISMKTNVAGAGHDIWAQHRYVTSSGEVFWIFILRDKSTKQIISMWQAPDHPCMGNGGKPLLCPHPFPEYDFDKQEIIVINPTPKELQEMRLKTIQSEGKADKDLLEVIAEEYEIDEDSRPKWPDKEVTVGLPPKWDDAWHTGEAVEPIKKVIPKPDYILCRKLKLKK